ncbi:MAG: galactose mutarotase [Aerococcus sp.]|nr:galactose mutarotase [Aerococcus sp.]
MKYSIHSFGEYHGESYEEIQITNDHGQTIGFSNLGARITRWEVPGNNESNENIILSYADARDVFENHDFYYGATVGRVAGRIANASFAIDHHPYTVDMNDGRNQNHGGRDAMDIAKWAYTISENSENAIAVTFDHTDKAGYNGYPGNLHVQVTHRFDNNNQWVIDYRATTDSPTLCNLTNHVYFNLNGDNQAPITNHVIAIDSHYYLPTQTDSIPVDSYHAVENTAFDLHHGTRYSEILGRFRETDLRQTAGYDHPWLLTHNHDTVASIALPERHRKISVQTDQPNLVVYTHNADEPTHPLQSRSSSRYAGLTFETQVAPDAIHHPNFGNVTLYPGEVYRQSTAFTFNEI